MSLLGAQNRLRRVSTAGSQISQEKSSHHGGYFPARSSWLLKAYLPTFLQAVWQVLAASSSQSGCRSTGNALKVSIANRRIPTALTRSSGDLGLGEIVRTRKIALEQFRVQSFVLVLQLVHVFKEYRQSVRQTVGCFSGCVPPLPRGLLLCGNHNASLPIPAVVCFV
jgi:hypothetical protein